VPIKTNSTFRYFRSYALPVVVLCWLGCGAEAINAQATSFGNGYSAAAEGRGGTLVVQQGDPIDAVEGNPSGLAGIKTRVLEATGVGVFGSGSFQNSANTNGRMGGVVGAMPYGAFVTPLGKSLWTLSVAETPEILMRANWTYVDAPGTLGVTYGLHRLRKNGRVSGLLCSERFFSGLEESVSVVVSSLRVAYLPPRETLRP
jgi:hypothetical protein